jgi:hypothetical protein
MHTDYMVIGRTRNADNIQRLVDGIESKYAKQSILNVPDLNWDGVTSQIENTEMKLDELLS